MVVRPEAAHAIETAAIQIPPGLGAVMALPVGSFRKSVPFSRPPFPAPQKSTRERYSAGGHACGRPLATALLPVTTQPLTHADGFLANRAVLAYRVVVDELFGSLERLDRIDVPEGAQS